MKGVGPLYDELHALSTTTTSRRRCSAASPRCRRSCASAARRTADRHDDFDLALERAFADAGEEFDVVSYVASGRHRGSSCTRARRVGRRHRVPEHVRASSSLERRTIILKIHGQLDRAPEREWESFVVSEDDYIDYLAPPDLATVVPVGLAAKLRRSHFLFLGYAMPTGTCASSSTGSGARSGSATARGRSSRARSRSSASSGARRGVDVLDLALDEYVELPRALRRRRLVARSPRRAAPPSPYKGLAPFDDSELDALLFFGREREQRDRHGEPGRRAADAALRRERRRQELAPARRGRAPAARAARTPRSSSSSCRRPLAEPSRRRLARGAPHAEAERRRGGEIYLILDQLEEYFVYHGAEQAPGTFAADFPSGSRAPACARTS